MNSKQLHLMLLSLCGLLIIIFFGTLYTGTQVLRSHSENLQAAVNEREVIEQQEIALITAQGDIDRYSELEELSKRIIPQEKDQARTVREILQIANSANVNITAINFPSSELGDENDQQIITQAIPVDNLQGLFELRITIQISNNTTFNQLINFLEGLETNRRTSQVQSVAITPDRQDRNVLTPTIELSVYLSP